MNRAAPLLGLALALALSIAGWAYLGRPIPLPDATAGRIPCVSYAPTSIAGSPLDENSATSNGYSVPAGLIRRDLRALSAFTSCIRTYAVLGAQGEVVAAAEDQGMQVMLGVWIGTNERDNAREIARGLELANAYPRTVRALVVGNEVLLRREMSGARLARLVREVKSRTRAPVAYADVLDYWLRNPEVAEAADLLLIHVLPYWDDPVAPPATEVMDRVREEVDQARKAFPTKLIEVGEVGWPSAGRTRGYAVPGRVNQARVVRELAMQASRFGVRFNLIEGIDQPWKRVAEGTVGGYWGILNASRQPKFPLTGAVREWPAWPGAAAFGCAVSLTAFAWGWKARRAVSARRWIALGIAAPLAGATMCALGAQLATVAVGWPGWTWACYLLGNAAAASVLGMRILLGPGLSDSLRESPLVDILTPGRSIGSRVRQDAWGGFAWLTRFVATVLALALAVDGRHRDYLTLAFILPACALALWAWTRRGMSGPEAQPEAGWVAAILLVAGACGIDALGDAEAWAWAGCCALLAAPWLRWTWVEVARIGLVLRRSGQ